MIRADRMQPGPDDAFTIPEERDDLILADAARICRPVPIVDDLLPCCIQLQKTQPGRSHPQTALVALDLSHHAGQRVLGRLLIVERVAVYRVGRPIIQGETAAGCMCDPEAPCLILEEADLYRIRQ